MRDTFGDLKPRLGLKYSSRIWFVQRSVSQSTFAVRQKVRQEVTELTSFRTVCMTCRMRRAIATVGVCSLLLFCFATLSSAHKRKSTQVLLILARSLQLVGLLQLCAFLSCLLTQSELVVMGLGTREPLSLGAQCLRL